MGALWTAREPGYFDLRNEVARLAARARRRRGLVLLGALLAAAAAVLFTLRSPRNHRARISVRVTEVVEFHLPRSSWTDRELRSYITDIAFTNQVLRQVYEQHLRPLDPKGDPLRAVERLRDQLEVQVVRNRVVVQMEGRTGPRSAHVVLGFAAPSAATASGVLRALAEPIMKTSAQRRRGEAALEVRRATLGLEQSRKLLADLNKQAVDRAGAPIAGTDISPVRLTALNDAIAEAQRRVERFAADKDAAERLERSEKARPGIDFVLAEESVQAPLPLAPLLLTVGIAVFLLALPLSVLVVGAFDPFVGSLEDIRRLGIPTLGRLRHVDDRTASAN